MVINEHAQEMQGIILGNITNKEEQTRALQLLNTLLKPKTIYISPKQLNS